MVLPNIGNNGHGTPLELFHATLTQMPTPVFEEADVRRQALIVYLTFYCRTGGVNWPLLCQNFDAAEIRAGQGYYGFDELLHEHVDKSNQYGVPYLTSWQIDNRQDAAQQGRLYARGYGVADHRMSIAFERTGGGLATSAQLLTCLMAVEYETGERPMIYSRKNLLEEIGDPAWLLNYDVEIAQYPYMRGTTSMYTTIERFIDERAWTLPPASANTTGAVEMWQTTRVLRARDYFANAVTNDPVWTSGLLSASFSVSTKKDHSEFIEWLGGTIAPPLTLEQKVERLWQAHPELW